MYTGIYNMSGVYINVCAYTYCFPSLSFLFVSKNKKVLRTSEDAFIPTCSVNAEELLNQQFS